MKRHKSLCRTCMNTACRDRCNPSQCEHYLAHPNEKQNKLTSIEWASFENQQLFS